MKMEVLLWLAKGLTNQEIRFRLSPRFDSDQRFFAAFPDSLQSAKKIWALIIWSRHAKFLVYQ